MKIWRRGQRAALALALLGIAAGAPHAEPQSLLVLQNIGLKNTYQIVFHDLQPNFASGVFEVLPRDEESETSPSLRIPFRADIKPDPKDRRVEILEVSSTEVLSFFPPANRRDPHPTLIWKLTDRGGKSPKLEATLWSFGRSAWTAEDMEFVRAK